MLLQHLAWPVGGTAARLTSTFAGQLFHHRLASTGSYAPTMRRLPVEPTELRADALSLIPLSRLVAQWPAAPPRLACLGRLTPPKVVWFALPVCPFRRRRLQ